MSRCNSNGRTACHASRAVAEKEASDRIAVLSLAEKLFTVKEYTQLCADVAKGCVEIRMYDDGIVLTRTFSSS